MAATAELSKEEEALFEQMAKGEGAAPPEEKKEEPAAKPVPEKAAPEKAVHEEPKKEQKTVPLEALHEARQENKELRKELEAMKGIVSEGDKKLQKFIESVTKQASAPPKFEDDPAANLKHENEELKKSIAEIQAKLEKQEGAAQQNDRLAQHASFVSAREAEFAKEHADYYQASEFVAAVWRDEFLEAGFKAEEVPKMVFGKALAITTTATKAEKNPAEAIYKIAKRYGFTAKQQETPKEAKKEDGESKLKQIEKGLETAKSAGGSSGPEEITLTSLAQMDDAQIEKLVADKDWWARNIRRSPLH